MKILKLYKELFEDKLSKDSLFFNFTDIGYVIRWLDEGGDVDVVDNLGDWSLLTLAANNNLFFIIKYLLEHGANPNKIKKNGNSALILTKKWKIFDLLLKHGADLTITNKYGHDVFYYLNGDVENSKNENVISHKIQTKYPEQYDKYLKHKKARKFNL